jgi:hypothetical protein
LVARRCALVSARERHDYSCNLADRWVAVRKRIGAAPLRVTPPSLQTCAPKVSARAAEKANSVAYEGPELAKQQKAGYPDLAPLKVGLPPSEVFKRALDAARTMPGWTVVDSDPASGRIEANDTSRWVPLHR